MGTFDLGASYYFADCYLFASVSANGGRKPTGPRLPRPVTGAWAPVGLRPRFAFGCGQRLGAERLVQRQFHWSAAIGDRAVDRQADFVGVVRVGHVAVGLAIFANAIDQVVDLMLSHINNYI